MAFSSNGVKPCLETWKGWASNVTDEPMASREREHQRELFRLLRVDKTGFHGAEKTDVKTDVEPHTTVVLTFGVVLFRVATE